MLQRRGLREQRWDMPLGQSGTWALFLECNRAIEHGAILTCWNGLSGRPAGVRLSEAPIDNLLWRCLDKYAPTCAEALNASFLTCHDLLSGGICVKKSLLMPCLVCSTCWTLLVQRPGPPIFAKVRMATGFRPLRAEQGRIMLVWQQIRGLLQHAMILSLHGRACSICLQVAADTVLFTPVYVGAFFAFMNSMDGGGWRVRTTFYSQVFCKAAKLSQIHLRCPASSSVAPIMS